MGLDDDSREYHRQDPPGKIEVATTKPTNTQHDLSLAYSPDVAASYLDITEDEDAAYGYTTKGNLVDVVSNGSAVLGLEDIEAQTSEPVMEGKGVLFKCLTDIDVFDVELDIADMDDLVVATKTMEPTFGGINLGDIKAPECFEIERQLWEQMDIPVFHDDRHGTVIISGAALLSAAGIVDKDLGGLDVVFLRAGASVLATVRFYASPGAKKENITMCDSLGIITESHVEDGDAGKYKAESAKPVDESSLSDAMKGTDVLAGLSVGGIVSQEMVRSMADNPVIFVMANPDPEITYEDVKDARDDMVVMATGRSDHPNQVSNALGLPFIFRGALDVRAAEINKAMKRAAAGAFAELARQDMPDMVVKAYGDYPLQFGADYAIPKPLDPRALLEVAPAVTQAAMTSGAARERLDMNAYREELEARLGKSREMTRVALNKARSNPERVILMEGEDERMIRAAYQMQEEGTAEPILVGETTTILRKAEELGLGFDPTIANPRDGKWDHYVDRLYELRQWKGVTNFGAEEFVRRDSNYSANVMVEAGDADAMLMGLTHHYPSVLRPPLQVIGTADDADYAAGVYMMTFKNRVVFCANTTVNLDPDEEVLAEITKHTADLARQFNVEPCAVLFSCLNFDSVTNEGTRRSRDATALLQDDPEIGFPVDGEIQADTALVEDILEGIHGFAELDGPTNVLVLPNLEAGNIGYKLLQRLGGVEAIGPMLVSMDKPAHVLRHGDEVKDIVNLAATAVVDAQEE